MRQWTPSPSSHALQVLDGLIGAMGQPEFASALLPQLHPLVPAASYSIYRTGAGCVPRLFMSASHGVPDTTRACWHAYLSGPYLTDRSFPATQEAGRVLLCHITAQEVAPAHRTRVYEAHGVAERVSVLRHDASSVFAINFYRHAHQRPFSDAQLADFETLAPTLLALTEKQIALSGAAASTPTSQGPRDLSLWREKLLRLAPAMSARELDVCARILAGMTHDGIASDLGLRLPTVKTYRNRAFARLGIHFKSELFARLHQG